MASAAATRAPRCAGTSRSTPRRSCRPRSRADSELEREPEQQALGEIAQQPRLGRQEADRGGALALDPVGEARDVARLVERDHQLVVEKEAPQVEVGRACERELLV